MYTMAWLEEHRAFIVEEFIKKMAGFLDMLSPSVVITDGRRVRQIWPLAIFFSGATSKQRFTNIALVTLEALKEAIRQEIAAITPEMILKVMDNCRERLHQCINIQSRHLSDVLFKTR